ncbi:MAG: hypothetical protein LAO30_05670 [Acidobacteriia bacterium]|nr:hypothetical protein [Terriglobia bacterium]
MPRTAFKIWTGGSFPVLSLDWFREFGVSDPGVAYSEWQAWLRPGGRVDDSRFRKALELATGLSVGAVSHYLSQFRPGENRTHHLGARALRQLDGVARSLGFTPPSVPAPGVVSTRGARYLAMVADLQNSPNPRFHLQVIDSIIRSCRMANLFVTIHAVSQADPEISRTLERILRQETLHGFVWFRITPGEDALKTITSFSEALPTIVVHGARVRYPWPVVAHVLPSQGKVRELVRLWARATPIVARRRTRGNIVVAAMPEQSGPPPFAPVEATACTSLREERVEMVCAGLKDAGKRPVLAFVEDYTAARAYDVVLSNPAADGFVCLSDELALATKHILLAQGKDATDRILGFDGTDPARAQRIPSINQGLNDIGQIVAQEFLAFLRQPKQHPVEFKEAKIDVSLQW